VWDAEVTFVQGVPAVVDLTTYARDPQGLPMQFREVEAMDAALEGAFHWRDTFLFLHGRDLGLKEGDSITAEQQDPDRSVELNAAKCPQCLGTGHRTRMGCYGPIVSMVWPCEVCRGTGLATKPKLIGYPLPYEPERGLL
jgi:hypothetical protein